jgi:hypothetical protein
MKEIGSNDLLEKAQAAAEDITRTFPDIYQRNDYYAEIINGELQDVFGYSMAYLAEKRGAKLS